MFWIGKDQGSKLNFPTQGPYIIENTNNNGTVKYKTTLISKTLPLLEPSHIMNRDDAFSKMNHEGEQYNI